MEQLAADPAHRLNLLAAYLHVDGVAEPSDRDVGDEVTAAAKLNRCENARATSTLIAKRGLYHMIVHSLNGTWRTVHFSNWIH